MKSFVIIGCALVLLVGGGVYFLLRGGTEMQAEVSSQSAAVAPMKATIVYTDDGFSPQMVTVAKGGEVVFVNRSGMPLWVASNPHPAHTDYPEFDTPKILGDRMPRMKEDIRFTFQKVGSWGFHNHSASGDTSEVAIHPGTVIVK